jgi:hypothetical protein
MDGATRDPSPTPGSTQKLENADGEDPVTQEDYVD